MPSNHERAGRAARITLVAVLLAGVATGLAANALDAAERHGLSSFGDLKYPPDFKHFDYVDPEAPKGGRLAMVGTGPWQTFDSFNGYILKGDAAQGLQLIFDSLMVRATDEPDAVYGLVAKSAEIATDGKSVVFKLRSEAKFADGTPLTAADVAFSFVLLKTKGHPSFRNSLRDVEGAEAIDPATVRYTFTGSTTRDLPSTVATLPIFSKAYYETREFDQSSLDPPLGSGPYKIGEFKPGANVSYARRLDYWARDLAVVRGRFNFDTIKFEYFRDRTAALQSLTAGAYDLREEFTSKDWATAYDIPPVKDGRLALLTMPDDRPSGAQGFYLNTRRGKFQDVRVRRAMNLAFDFEWTNKNVFFDLYKRTNSMFENSDLKATGKPSPEELALLEPHRAILPPEVFAEPFVSPVSDASGSDRKLLREASGLLTQAGWEQKGGQRINKAGERLEIEFLLADPGFERILQPYIKNLEAIGIKAEIRTVDPAQYQRRVKGFEFDVVTHRSIMRLNPGVELFNLLSSRAADTEGSTNLAGIKNPAVDALLEAILAAKTRAELVAACHALDRVLRAAHHWVPQWYKAAHNFAHWNRFSRPPVKPKFDDGVVDTWWYDAAKSAKLRAN